MTEPKFTMTTTCGYCAETKDDVSYVYNWDDKDLYWICGECVTDWSDRDERLTYLDLRE